MALELWMKEALSLARKAGRLGEVPVGALVIYENQVIATAYNRRESLKSPLGHAEILALHKASKILQSWRLQNCTLVVTLEPCLMCAGALLQSRIQRLIYGAKDPKAGAVQSLYSVLSDSRLNHQIEVVGGICEQEAGHLLSSFFQNLRSHRKMNKQLKKRGDHF